MMDSPKPISRTIMPEGDAPAFIPYPPVGEALQRVPMYLRPDLHYYMARLAFLPNEMKLALHVPWVATHLLRFNNAVMRDDRNRLSEHLKYKMSFVISRNNECIYCTTHHVGIFKHRWDKSEEELDRILSLEAARDEREGAALEFVHQGSLDPAGVTDAIRKRLAHFLSPQEAIETVLVLGFWEMYNTVTSATGVPLEDPMVQFHGWAEARVEAGGPPDRRPAGAGPRSIPREPHDPRPKPPRSTAASPPAARPIGDEVVEEGDAPAFVPYPPIGDMLEHVPVSVRPDVHYYIARMGFLPHTIKLYLHVPWAARPLMRLNNAIMRDERNTLDEHLKYQLALIASRANGCPYCTAHTVGVFKRRWEKSDDEIERILRLEAAADERQAAAMEFVYQASLDPVGVIDEMRQRLAELFSPQEVMEIVLTLGFWKMYTTMHIAMAAPLEDPVTSFRHWVDAAPPVASRSHG